jgi:hypothetical protein
MQPRDVGIESHQPTNMGNNSSITNRYEESKSLQSDLGYESRIITG